MSLFDVFPIPRRVVAQEIAGILLGEPADKPIHIHGPEGYGKRSLCRALAEVLADNGRKVATVSLCGADGQSEGEVLSDGLVKAFAKELKCEDVPELADGLDLGKVTFEALSKLTADAADNSRAILIVQGSEWLLLTDSFRRSFLIRYAEATGDRSFDLVTLSAFSSHALGISGRVKERALLPFITAQLAPNPFADTPTAEGDECLIEIREWVKERHTKAEAGRALSQVTVDGLMPQVENCITKHNGHPYLSIAAINLLLTESEQNGIDTMRRPSEILEGQVIAWASDPYLFREELFPQLSFPESLPTELCEKAVQHLNRLLAKISDLEGSETEKQDVLEGWIGLGLKAREGQESSFLDNFPQMRTWVTPDWVKGRVDALRLRIDEASLRKSRHENRDDEHLSTVESEVKRAFCNDGTDASSERPKGRYSLLDLETQVVERGIQYKLTLQRELPNEPDKGFSQRGGSGKEKKTRLRIFTRETLHVFRNFSRTGEQLWSQHNAILRRLSSAKNPALPQVYYGGRIAAESDGDSDQRSMGYLLLHDLGPPIAKNFATTQELLTKPLPDADKTKPVEVALRAAELTKALALLHSKGVAHRHIDLNAIKVSSTVEQTHLTLSGFEFSLILNMMTLGGEGTRDVRHENTDPKQSLPFCSIDRIRALAEGDEFGFGVITWAENDVHAMCAMLCYLFTGELASEQLDELCQTLKQAPEENRETACRAVYDALRLALLDKDRWKAAEKKHQGAYIRFLEQIRNLAKEVFTPISSRQRLSADDLSRRVSFYLDEYRHALLNQSNAKFALYYDSRKMGPNIEKLGFLNDDGITPEGRARLEDKLAGWLGMVSEIRYREEGFFGRSGESKDETRRAAKYMLVSDEVVMFASFHQDPTSKSSEHRLLRLSFTVYRSDVHLIELAEDQKVPFPKHFKLHASDEIHNIALSEFEDWQRVFQPAERAASRVSSTASASLHLHRQLLLAKEELKRFPVTVEKNRKSAFLKLDRPAYRKAKQSNEFINLALQTGRNDEAIFVDAVAAWCEDLRAGNAKIQFHGRSAQRPVKFDLDVISVETNQIEVSSNNWFTDSGWLIFSDHGGATHASALQEKAIDRFIAKQNLFQHLDRPRNQAPVTMRAPVEYEQEFGKQTVSVIQNIKSGYPITALQGPPGSGKTTTIALTIADMLADDETLRFLITSQSHAAVDVTLGKVMSVFGDTPKYTMQGEQGEVPDAIRLLPGRNSDRVSKHVRDNYAIKTIVDKKLDSISSKAEEKLAAGNLTAEMREAYLALQDAGKKSAFEIWNRLERHAPLVFGTTAASSTAQKMGSQDEDFDVVIIDEAAKAFGIDLVQPLSIAHQVIMVGDHKQLSPFDYDGSQELFNKVRDTYIGTQLEAKIPEEVSIISDSDNFDDAISWLTPFERFFDKAKQALSSPGTIPVTQMLSLQHRSFEPIGELVSNTFYKGKVATAPSLKLKDYGSKLPWLPEIDSKSRAPVIIWVDTANLDSETTYECNYEGAGRLFNDGEINIVERVLQQSDLEPLKDEGLSVEECCKVMSPYAEQVRRLTYQIQGSAGHLDPDILENLDRVVQTIDSSQGAESALVVVSMTRTGTVKKPHEKTSEGYELEMKKSLGFLTDAARMNVMFSRAMRQLVIVGDFELFRSFDDQHKEWIRSTENPAEKKSLAEAYGFWGLLLGHFQSDNLDANIIRVDAQKIKGLID